MPRVKRSVIEANAFRLLAYLDTCASGRPREAMVPLRAMVRELQLTHANVRHLVRVLVGWGYIEVRHCFAEDGGGMPNAHRITRLGAAALKAYQAGAQESSAHAASDEGDAAGAHADERREGRQPDREQEQETSWQSHR